jgi:hypothetical protein
MGERGDSSGHPVCFILEGQEKVPCSDFKGGLRRDDLGRRYSKTYWAAALIPRAENGEGPGVRLRKKADTHEDLTRRIHAIDEHLDKTDHDAPASPERGMQQLEDARKKDIGVRLRNKRSRIDSKKG